MPNSEATTARPVAMYLARRQWAQNDVYRFLFVVFDLDASRGGAVRVWADALALGKLLAAHGIRAVPVASGPGGGVHLWTSVPKGMSPSLALRIMEAAQALFPTLDTSPMTNPAAGAVRPPGSLHRKGGFARLTAHTIGEAVVILRSGSAVERFEDFAATLEAMAGAPALLDERRAATTTAFRTETVPAQRVAGREYQRGRVVPPSIAARGPVLRPIAQDASGHDRIAVPWRPVGTKALAALHRTPGTGAGDHQRIVHTVLVMLAAAGWSYDQAAQLVADKRASPALEWLRTSSNGARRVALSPAQARSRMKRCWQLAVWDAARRPRRATDTPDATEALTEGAAAAADLLARMEAVGAAYWARQSGPMDRAILRAVAYLMARSGSADVSASCRVVAVLAGCHADTVAQALRERLLPDGWLAETAPASLAGGIARRIAVAAEHQCPTSEHHRCALHTLPAVPATPHKTPVHTGSDRSGNTPPPPALNVLLSQLPAKIVFQQSGLWHSLGHHAARTLEALETGVQLSQLTVATGYGEDTIRRHLDALQTVQVIQIRTDPRTGRQRAVRTSRSLYEAAAELGTATRTAEQVMTAVVDQERARWWSRDVEWCREFIEVKREQGMRAPADQMVLPGMDPYDRKYPRFPGAKSTGSQPGKGRADHRRAWEIEAQRIGALEYFAAADELAQAGRVVELPAVRSQLAPQIAETDTTAAAA
ncbi:hypothetical protein QMK19_29020 [Streptomyces sp. H10-C2]|uniref:hypothetical protein n=1 Tax=Streptomyces TaxID=1883 RepID=UPI0018DF70DF|nr:MULTISPECIES: hypothetical protein [Streptomyces]MDJ0344253.1 hypothetical protein [Streptomyces sp. PH10-H1]MDJ0373591.1 hypothetical protein [Streptomyces sp. H10-C2]